MKIELYVVCTLLGLGSWSAKAQSLGPSSGGGGFVVDCAATILEPARVELLDLYEAKTKIPGVEIVGATGNLTEDYFWSVQRTYARQGDENLAGQMRPAIEENLKRFFRSVKMVQSVDDMPMALDAGALPWIPSSCTLKQVAFFDDGHEIIYLNQNIWSRLDSKNQAALVQHELWYRTMRGLDDKTSELARIAVAHVFAQYGVAFVNDGVPATAIGFSGIGGSAISEFKAFPVIGLGQKFLRMQFTQLQGRPALAKTWIDVPFVAIDSKVWSLGSRFENIGMYRTDSK